MTDFSCKDAENAKFFRGAAQVVVTKIHFMNNIHFCVFRNVQKEKKDVTVFSSVFFRFFPASWNFFPEKQNNIVISYFNVIIEKACLTQAGEAS